MKTKLIALAGVALIGLGIWGLFRPNVMMPAKRQDIEIHGQRVMMESRRIVAVPRPLSGLIIVCGIALIAMSIQEM